jgi:hypothetical protein
MVFVLHGYIYGWEAPLLSKSGILSLSLHSLNSTVESGGGEVIYVFNAVCLQNKHWESVDLSKINQ